jgi:Cu-Zn family superoxide dismutase
MKKFAACALTFLLPALVLSGGQGAGEAKTAGEHAVKAVAHLHARSGSKLKGTIYFKQQGGVVTVTGTISGLKPGEHGFHIHEFGDCSEEKGMSAGGHYNPSKKMHAGPHDADRHEGDLGNIKADGRGVAKINISDKMLRLSGPHSIVGRSVVVHAKRDDLKSQPAGDAGDRIGCGVIGYAK